MGRLLGNGPLSARLGWRQSECATDLAHDLIRPAQKIGCCVAQQPNTRVGKAVLATVVINQSIAVGSAVVLDTESVGGVIKVGPAEEATELVVHLHLHLRSRQASKDEQSPEATLHRRFRGRVGQFDDSSQAHDAHAARTLVQQSAQPRLVHQSKLQGRIHGCNSLDKR